MPDTDAFEDDEWTEEDEHGGPVAAMLAADPLINTVPLDPPAKKGQLRLTDEQRDAPLWATDLPDSKTEAKYWGNLGLRIVRGITSKEIKKLNVKDRVAAASVCFDKKQLLLDRPTANINFEMRKSMQETLPLIQQELERRRRERMVVDVTPQNEE